MSNSMSNNCRMCGRKILQFKLSCLKCSNRFKKKLKAARELAQEQNEPSELELAFTIAEQSLIVPPWWNDDDESNEETDVQEVASGEGQGIV